MNRESWTIPMFLWVKQRQRIENKNWVAPPPVDTKKMGIAGGGVVAIFTHDEEDPTTRGERDREGERLSRPLYQPAKGASRHESPTTTLEVLLESSALTLVAAAGLIGSRNKSAVTLTSHGIVGAGNQQQQRREPRWCLINLR